MKIKEGGKFATGKVVTKLFDLQGNLIEKKTQYNVVVTSSKNGFAGILNSESTFTGNINYGAVGTGADSAVAADTLLQTELDRVIPTSQSRAGNVTTLLFAFAPTDANGSLKEFGAFIDGTAAADSGTLFNRVNIDVVKTTLNTLTIELIITVL